MSAARPASSDWDRYSILLVIAAAWLVLWFVLPLVLMAWRFLSAGEVWRIETITMLTSPLYVRVYLNTIQVSVLVTVFTLILGYPVAYLLTTVSQRVFNMLILLVLFPMWVNIVVRTYAFLIVLGRNGILNSTLIGVGVIDEPMRLIYTKAGVYLGMTQILLPYMILTIFGAIKGIDRTLFVAARSLGAPERHVFWRVLLPLSLPGVWGGVLLVFVSALGFYVTPAMLGGPADVMIAMLIDEQANGLGNFAMATILGLALLVLTVAMLAVYDIFLNLDRLWGRL